MSDFVIDFRKSKRERPSLGNGRRGYPRQRRETKLGYRIGEAYFSGVRPMDTGGTIVDDLIWRRTEANKPPLTNKAMFSLLKAKFIPYWVKLEKVYWSRYAGCTCPCSPGYVLYGRIDHDARRAAGIGWEHPYYFNVQEDEFSVWVCTKEYHEVEEAKKAARLTEKRAKAVQDVIDAGVYGI